MARTEAAGRRNGKSDVKIDEQISKIRKDISELAGAVGDAGVIAMNDLKSNATAKRDEYTQRSLETIEELRAQLNAIEDRVAGKVRERPLTALGIAAGIGFLVALMARR